jgi:tetratricopeptide (TPR) repeat protein/signal recognition particle subunit SEC65
MGPELLSPIKDERRRFRRYPKETAVKIIRDNEIFDLQLLDYSPAGIKVKSRTVTSATNPVFYPGESVEIIMDHYHQRGRIVWVSGNYTGIAIDGPIEGELQSYRLWDVLIGLRRSKKTGVLEIVSDNIRKHLYINSGEVIFASSNIEDERFGEFLLKKGLITLDAYNHSVELMKKTGRRQGALLVEAGYIKPEDLPSLVREQIEEIIKNSFKLLRGTFIFKEGPLPREEIITLRMSLANLIYRGIKGIESFQFIRSEISDLNSIPQASTDPYELFQDICLEDMDKEILLLVDGKRTIMEILKESRFNHFETLKTIYALLATRIIELKKKEEVASGKVEEAVSMSEVIKNNEFDDWWRSNSEFLKEVDELYNRIDLLNHYEILGLSVSYRPTDLEIKKAYYSLVKKFHPDRYYKIGHEELRNKLSRIFSRINQAYTVLSDPLKRQEYDAQLFQSSTTVTSQQRDNQTVAIQKFETGITFYRQGSFEEAATALGQAVYLDGSKPKYHFYYGLALREIGRYKEAEKSLLRAIELWPDNPEYITELGYLYLRLDMKLRAKKTFERALHISPEYKKAKEGLRKTEE